MKTNTLGALIAIYSEEPYKNFDDGASQYAQQLVQENPNDAKNLYAHGQPLREVRPGRQGGGDLPKVADLNPNDPKACGALAAFYNKPLWDGRSKFDQAIDVLQRCASLAPDDPGGYQKVASFYWDKAYRDPLITDEQKQQYAEKGMEAVDKALEIKPDYFDAIIYKGLLYRVMASVARNPGSARSTWTRPRRSRSRAWSCASSSSREAAAAAAGSPAATRRRPPP